MFDLIEVKIAMDSHNPDDSGLIARFSSEELAIRYLEKRGFIYAGGVYDAFISPDKNKYYYYKVTPTPEVPIDPE